MPIKYRDIEKEKAFLAIMLKTRRINKYDLLQKVVPTTFTTPITRHLFILIRDYYGKYFAPISPEVALNKSEEIDIDNASRKKLKRMIKKLASSEISIKLLDYIIEELVLCEHSRNIQKLLVNAKDIFKDTGNPFIVRDFINDEISANQSREQHDVEVLDLRKDFRERYKHILYLKKKGEFVRGISSGIDDRFDEQTCGYCPGDLIIFVSQTSGGKSICMQDQTVYMAIEENERIAYVTNEMTATQTAYRMDARLAEIRYGKFRRPPNMRRVDLLKWKTSMKELSKNRIKILGMHDNCSAAAIDAKLKEINFKPTVLFIDYIQNMVPNVLTNREYAADAQPQAQIVRETKNLALKRKIPIISAGQLKPEAEGKSEIEIKDIAISKQALSQWADCLFAIIQTKAMKMRMPPRAKIQFLKIREGKTREFIEIIPNFNLIRLHDPRVKRLYKTKKKDR